MNIPIYIENLLIEYLMDLDNESKAAELRIAIRAEYAQVSPDERPAFHAAYHAIYIFAFVPPKDVMDSVTQLTDEIKYTHPIVESVTHVGLCNTPENVRLLKAADTIYEVFCDKLRRMNDYLVQYAPPYLHETFLEQYGKYI